MILRHRFKHTDTLKERLASFARDVREKADLMPSGPEREAMLRKARQADTAAHIEDWISSPGLQPPK